MNARFFVIVLLAGLFIVFMFQNDELLKVRFAFWSVIMSKSLLILLVFVAGLIFGWISFAWGQRRGDSARGKKRTGR